jgi:hypothetical protein
MKLTPYAKIVKAELAMELEKIGSSLEEFEKNLSTLNTAEGAIKVASDVNLMHEYALKPAMGMASGLPGLAFNASAAGGAVAGLTFDDMENSVVELNKALERERQKVHMVRTLTHRLKQEHGLN